MRSVFLQTSKLLCLFALVVLSVACKNLDSYTSSSTGLNEDNYQQFNGMYNAQPDSSYKRNLADFLIVNHYLNYPSEKMDSFYDTLSVELKFIDSKTLSVSVYRNGELESIYELPGRLRRGYFELFPQYDYDPEIPVVLGTFTVHESRFTITEQKEIKVDLLDKTYLQVLFFKVPVMKRRYSDNVFYPIVSD